MDFILNDESRVNSHGFILVNSGGDFERFRRNPVMLHNHNFDELIGLWDNIRIEGSLLKAEPKFDMDDEFSKKIEGKVIRGFLKGASPCIKFTEAEFRPLPDGTVIPFITCWELMEASIVTVPSNDNALKLYNSKGEVLENVEQIQLNINSIINSKRNIPIQTGGNKMSLYGREDWDYKRWFKDDPKGLQRLQAENPVAFEKLKVAYNAKFRNGSINLSGREDWDYKRWMKDDPKGLQRLQVENPAAFEQLKAAYKAKLA